MRNPTLCLLILAWAVGAAAQDYEIYVSDAGNLSAGPWQVLRYDADGDNPEVFTNEGMAWPQDILFLEDRNEVLISQLNTNRVNRHDATTGALIDVFAAVTQPTRMAIGPDGLIYVLPWVGDGRVRRFEQDGTLVDLFTNVGVSNAIGIDWDDDGNLYVASFNGASVRRFDENGIDQGLFINSNLVGPTNIRFDDDGNLLVLDWQGNGIRLFDAAGQFIGNFATGIGQPEGIDVLPSGNLLVGHGTAGSLREFTPDGAVVQELVTPGLGGLIQPNGVTIRPLGQPFPINATLNDAWFDPETAGQGFLITVFPDQQRMFVAWFTFDVAAAAKGTMLGGAGQRWLTAQGPYEGDTADLTLFNTTGGVFDSAQPAPATNADGTLTIRFTGCNAAVAEYTIDSPGLSGEIPIQRVAADNIAVCEGVMAR